MSWRGGGYEEDLLPYGADQFNDLALDGSAYFFERSYTQVMF